MTSSSDIGTELQERVRQAAAQGSALRIRGGDTKAFYGRQGEGETLAMSPHQGIVDYEPTELVITARAGTPLREVEAVLAAQDQMLPFEPPHFGPAATLGGAVASGLSGPRRPYAGAVRDFVLGVVCLNGKGQRLSFGGQVMKNVAGYDVSRLMTGAMGTLGVLLEVSLKVLPRPAQELSLALATEPAQALRTMNGWAGRPLPLSATCYEGDTLRVRLSGSASGVAAAREKLGGEVLEEGTDYWSALREQSLSFFAGAGPLWRLAVAPAAAPLALDGPWLIEWGGAQRWYRGAADANALRQVAAAAGGHATLFRGGDRTAEVFHPLTPQAMRLHRNLKHAFDPAQIFNPQRMYREI